MQDDHELHIAQKSNKTGGGAGYRFNFYGGNKGSEDEEKKKKKDPSAPVEVHLSSEAEEALVKAAAEDGDEGEKKAEGKPDVNKTSELEKRDYSAIVKNRRKLGQK